MQAETAVEAASHYSDSVAVEGILPGARRFGRDALLAMAQTHSGPTTVECYSGRHIRNVERLRGVRLTALLDEAGMHALPRSRCKQLVIAVQAGDGYACLFTWHELYNTPVGQGALLMVEQDGDMLPRSAGGLQLISLHDLRLGPRQAIAVNRIVVNAWRS